MVESLEPAESTQPNSAHDRKVTALLAEHRDSLARFLRLCGARQEAEDVLQETYERVWKYRHSCDLNHAPKAWLQQAAFRCWLDFRKRTRKQPVPFGDRDATVLARADEAPELRDQLQHALQHTTDLERTLLLRFHQQGDTLIDIANDLDMNVNTVKSHLHRARQRLPRGDWS